MTWIPKKIGQTISAGSKETVLKDRWNELWNLIITQGDYNSDTLNKLINTGELATYQTNERLTALENEVDTNETDIENKFTNLTNTVNTNETDIENKLTTHKTSADHDGRYTPSTTLFTKLSQSLGAPASIQGVSNAAGDITLVGGTGIKIFPDNAQKKITIQATGENVPAAHVHTHYAGGTDPLTPADIGAATAGDMADVQAYVDNHKTSTMPHQFVDNGVTYTYGWAIANGILKFIYEEVQA